MEFKEILQKLLVETEQKITEKENLVVTRVADHVLEMNNLYRIVENTTQLLDLLEKLKRS